MKYILLKLITVFIIAGVHTLHAQSANEVIDKYFNAVSNGGIENWSKIKSAYIERTTSFTDPNHDKTKVDFTIKKPSLHISYVLLPDMSLTEIYEDLELKMSTYKVKGKAVIIIPNMAPMPVGSDDDEPISLFEPVSIQHNMAKSRSIKLLGTKVIDGIECFDIEIKTKKLMWHYYFNTSSYLLEYWTNSMNDFSTLTKVFNYEKHGEYLIAMSESKTSNDVLFFSSHIRKIQLNVDIPLERFQYKKE
jgi:hypothetical protein